MQTPTKSAECQPTTTLEKITVWDYDITTKSVSAENGLNYYTVSEGSYLIRASEKFDELPDKNRVVWCAPHAVVKDWYAINAKGAAHKDSIIAIQAPRDLKLLALDDIDEFNAIVTNLPEDKKYAILEQLKKTYLEKDDGDKGGYKINRKSDTLKDSEVVESLANAFKWCDGVVSCANLTKPGGIMTQEMGVLRSVLDDRLIEVLECLGGKHGGADAVKPTANKPLFGSPETHVNKKLFDSPKASDGDVVSTLDFGSEDENDEDGTKQGVGGARRTRKARRRKTAAKRTQAKAKANAKRRPKKAARTATRKRRRA